MMNRPTRAVIPVAGLATRAQPLCRSIPKEMLPLGRRPVIHHVVKELFGGGAREFLLIAGTRSSAIEKYFSPDAFLDQELERKGIPTGWHFGDAELSECKFQSAVQAVPSGVADAVYLAREFVNGAPFFLHMGDSVISGDDAYARRMVDALVQYHASVVVLVQSMLVDDLCSHGMVLPAREPDGDVFEIKSIVEKPSRSEATGRFGLVGRYLIAAPMVEFPLQDEPRVSPVGALGAILPAEEDLDGPVIAVKMDPEATLHDAGTLAGYLKAQVAFALNDAELGQALRAHFCGAIR